YGPEDQKRPMLWGSTRCRVTCCLFVIRKRPQSSFDAEFEGLGKRSPALCLVGFVCYREGPASPRLQPGNEWLSRLAGYVVLWRAVYLDEQPEEHEQRSAHLVVYPHHLVA